MSNKTYFRLIRAELKRNLFRLFLVCFMKQKKKFQVCFGASSICIETTDTNIPIQNKNETHSNLLQTTRLHGACSQKRHGVAKSSCRQTRTGAAQALVVRHVQERHKSTCTGALYALMNRHVQVPHNSSCRQTVQGASHRLLQSGTSRCGTKALYALMNRHVQVPHNSSCRLTVQMQHRLLQINTSMCGKKNTCTCEAQALVERHVRVQHNAVAHLDGHVQVLQRLLFRLVSLKPKLRQTNSGCFESKPYNFVQTQV